MFIPTDPRQFFKHLSIKRILYFNSIRILVGMIFLVLQYRAKKKLEEQSKPK